MSNLAPTARERLAVLLLGTLASLASASPAAKAVGPYHTSGPLQGSLVHDEPVPVYSADPADSWNRIHYLLFKSRSKALVYLEDSAVPPPASTEQTALARQLHRRFLTRTVIVRRVEGGDRPDFFFPATDIGFLLERSRFEPAAAALEAELAAPHLADRAPEARVLFQQDLWNRFDGLAPAESDTPVQRTRRQRLRSLVGRVMARVALPREELGRIGSNLPEAAQAHPEIGPDLLASDTQWRELEVTAGGETLQSSHAKTANYRRVFRVFVRVPDSAGGPSCLERFADQPRAVSVPCAADGMLVDGTRALLLETLLAVSDRGAIVAVPLVLNAETRTFSRLDPARLGLADRPFAVLHGSRLALSTAGRVAGGLEALPADEPVPQLLACFPRQRGGPLLPARLACQTCHGLDGRRLMIDNFKMETRLSALHPDNTRVQERVILAKEQSADYHALRAFFPRN